MIWKSVVVAATVLFASCSGVADVRVEATGFVAVGHDDAPDGCTVDDVGGLVIAFLDAFNSGTIGNRVDEFIASADRFAWFSVDERQDSDAFDRASLGDFLQAWSDTGEVLRLVDMDTEYELARNITHIAFNVERSGSAPSGSGVAVAGKGAVDCESGTIMVWSMGTTHPDPPALCQPPPDTTNQDLAVVCVRSTSS